MSLLFAMQDPSGSLLDSDAPDINAPDDVVLTGLGSASAGASDAPSATAVSAAGVMSFKLLGACTTVGFK